MKKFFFYQIAVAVLLGALPVTVAAQASKPSWQSEWDRVVAEGKKEGKVVVSLPASAELRRGLEEGMKKRFGIEVESVAARGSVIVRRIIEEYKAGVHYFDVHVGGSESIIGGLLREGILEPVEPWFVLPQVKDPKNWWGGHIWIDNAKRYVYAFQAYQTASIWYNTKRMQGNEIRSFDDLLDPKWKGEIGFLDPRTPGSGASMWSYLLQVKGEGYLKRLVDQKMLISRDQRVLAETLAKGKLALVIGLTYYSYAPFVEAGLPLKALPAPREGLYASGGSGDLVIIKHAPHPNATKVFVNWLLSQEGQEVFSKALAQGTRRLDVDTKWLQKYGDAAAKDVLTVEQYYKLENQSEEKFYKIREPGAELARKLLN